MKHSPTKKRRAVRRGDLWLLGNHRLVCGDATAAADVIRARGGRVPRLMVTDPPYGVSYDPSWRIKVKGARGAARLGTVANDDRANWLAAWKLFDGDVAYVWHASLHAPSVRAQLEATGLRTRSLIIWAKQQLVFGRGHYHWQHECCLYLVRKGRTANWTGDRKQTTIWRIANLVRKVDDVDVKTDHSTQKPVECMARAVRNHGAAGDDVYDPFAGSGSTLIACEQLGRRCMALEITPAYCQLIIDRWEKLTGRRAELAA